MKRVFYPLLLLCTLLAISGCESYETYSDLKEKERDYISQFISNQGIQVIDEETFNAQGQNTYVESNQFVRFDRNGVYMQIVRKGCGDMLYEKTTETLLCRYMEMNLSTLSVETRNDIDAYITVSSVGTVNVSQYIDKMSVYRTGTTITASFISGMMYLQHGSTTVPSGWLVPLNYINVGYPEKDGDEVAKVRLIVPHSQGTSDASSDVIPYYYEITYQRAL